MADNAAIRSGISTLIQDHLSQKLVNLLTNVMPLTYFLLGKDGNKKGNLTGGTDTAIYGLGRRATGFLLTGVPVGKTRREQVLNSDRYMPIVQVSNPPASDGKVLTQRDTMPSRTNWHLNSPVTRYKRPFFKWVERVDPISVPKKDIRRVKTAAPNEKLASKAIGDLFTAEADNVMSTHLQWWNQHFWGTDGTGYPADVDAEVWDNIYSVKQSLLTNNIYGGIDRTVSANAFWRGNAVATHRAAVLEDLVNYANYDLGCAKKGIGINLLLCGANLFPIFAAEAKAKGGQIYYDGLPDMGEFGFKKPIVRFNNTFVVYDPECPSKINGADKNAVAGLNLDTWTMAISPGANFTVDEAFDQSKVKGGADEITSNIRTEMIFACEAPSVNVWFDDVG
jgi:hypothetical protein